MGDTVLAWLLLKFLLNNDVSYIHLPSSSLIIIWSLTVQVVAERYLLFLSNSSNVAKVRTKCSDGRLAMSSSSMRSTNGPIPTTNSFTPDLFKSFASAEAKSVSADWPSVNKIRIFSTSGRTDLGLNSLILISRSAFPVLVPPPRYSIRSMILRISPLLLVSPKLSFE